MPRSKLLFLSLICSSVFACGGRSELDDYEHGLASVVPRTNAEGRGDKPANGNGDGDGDAPSDGDGDGDGNKPGGDGDDQGDGALLPIGSACAESDECGSEDNHKCLEEISVLSFFTVAFPGGMCTSSCTSDADCPDDSACLKDFGTPGCMPLCNSVSDCRGSEGYTCGKSPSPGSQDSNKYCLPPLSIPGLPF